MNLKKVASNRIISLEKGEIFVFGSNRGGIHGAGAAKTALNKFGAVWGQASGLQGRSYGIPTKDRNVRTTLTPDEIRPHVNRFIKFAIANPQLTFLVTEIGCGLAGHKYKDIAPLFTDALPVDNIKLPENFLKIIQP